MSATGGAKVIATVPKTIIGGDPLPKYRDLTPQEYAEVFADLPKLRIITAAHRCNGREDASYVPVSYEQKGRCASYHIAGLPVSIYDVAHYVLEPVARVDGPDVWGNYTAYGTQGSMMAGKPTAVAKQLRAWREPGQERVE